MSVTSSKIRTIKKVLIANRGEIAVRIIRGCRDLDIRSVAVYSEADRASYHVRLADEAYCIGPAPSIKSYLRIDNVIAVAKESGADAIHPGYGFLAENAEFAQACADNGIIFIGPRPETITALGDKLEARAMALKAGLPIAPGVESTLDDLAQVKVEAKRIGFPVLIKAAAGGGGKGMRIAYSDGEIPDALASAQREAQSAFGDSRVFIEKYIERPRHIEFQIFGDTHGNVVHLFERECSIQRRHQKVIEEAPSSFMTPELRETMGAAAVAIGKAAGYVGAGTVEFLVDEESNFYFLEVNTRLQVEHPVTEMITGIDLVKEQIRVAEGHPLSFTQDELQISGWAIESRIYAEDPENNFLPSTGILSAYRQPAGPGVRVDAGVVIGSEVSVYYDPMIAKLVIWGADRQQAIERSLRALAEYRITGVRSTIGFARTAISSAPFRSGDISTSFLQDYFPDNKYEEHDPQRSEIAAIACAVTEFRRSEKILAQMTESLASQSNWKVLGRKRGMRE